MLAEVERARIAVMEALLGEGDLSAIQHAVLAALAQTLGWRHVCLWEVVGPVVLKRCAQDDSPTNPPELPQPGDPLVAMTSTHARLRIPNDGDGWLIVAERGGETADVPEAIEVLEHVVRTIGIAFARERDRAALEAQLRASQARWARLVSSDVLGVLVGTSDGRVEEANNAFLQMLGYTAEDIRSGTLRWDSMTPPEWSQLDEIAIEQLARNGIAPAFQKEFLRRDGSRVPIIIGAASLGGEPLSSVAFVIDNSTQKQIEHQLAQLNAELELRVSDAQSELRALARRLDSIREDQLAEIAREIHDVFGQDITVLKVDAAWLLRRLANTAVDPDALTKRVRAMSERMDALLGVARRISTELRPKILDDLGLVAAIETHARDLARRVDFTIELSLPDELPLEKPVATALYRIYQELLTNVIRHASARKVQVTLTAASGVVQLTCADDGVGIDTGHTSAGIGLVGIRERTRALGGQFSICALAPHGTEAVVVLPRTEP